MANYIGWILTNKGRELLSKAINNETKINVTKFKIGAGYNTGNDRELIDLLDKRNEFPVNSYERKENGIVEFTFIVSNKTGTGESTITNSYKISEMGIYAQDDSGTEILYAYNKGTDGDYIPVYNGKNAIDIVEKCIIIIDQAANLNVIIDSSMTYLTRESADRRYLEIQALAKIIGLEYGGNIQDAGTKTTGKFYYDKALKYYYECIVNNSLTYNDGSKFRAISNKPILDKVENLFRMTDNQFEFGKLIMKIGRASCRKENGANGTVINFPVAFPNKLLFVTGTDAGSGADSVSFAPTSKNQFTAWGRNPGNGSYANTVFDYIAIGY